MNPVGPGTERLYRAWVRVLDGAAPSPIESIVGREQIIPAAADPQSLHFTLGYVDDDYTDNSYERHDDGIDQQCAGQEGARLSLTILRARRASLVARASPRCCFGAIRSPNAQLVAHAVSEAATTAVWPGGGSLNALRIGAYRRVDESHGAATSGFDLFVLADQTGMQWDAERHAYVGTLWFSVLERADSSAPFTDLPTEIPVQLSADGATVEPKDPIVKQTRRRLAVTVSTRRFVDKVRVHIVPLGLLRPTDIDFAVRQERLVLTLDDTIERFALGHTDVTVALPQGASHDSVAVRLTKVDGSVAPPTVWVTATRPAFAKFWSGGGRVDRSLLPPWVHTR